MADPRPKSYEEMLALWRSKLREARDQYAAAVERYQQVSRDYKAGLFVPPDGWLALSKAQRNESMALKEYLRVAKIFSDLLLRGR